MEVEGDSKKVGKAGKLKSIKNEGNLLNSIMIPNENGQKTKNKKDRDISDNKESIYGLDYEPNMKDDSLGIKETNGEIETKIKDTKKILKDLIFEKEEFEELQEKLRDLKFISTTEALELEGKLPKTVLNAKLNLDFKIKDYGKITGDWNYELESKEKEEMTSIIEDSNSRVLGPVNLKKPRKMRATRSEKWREKSVFPGASTCFGFPSSRRKETGTRTWPCLQSCTSPTTSRRAASRWNCRTR